MAYFEFLLNITEKWNEGEMCSFFFFLHRADLKQIIQTIAVPKYGTHIFHKFSFSCSFIQTFSETDTVLGTRITKDLI